MSVPFALVEVVGILAGRRDTSYLNFFNPRLPNYSGEGETYPGAYGYRLRQHFGMDQLERVCEALAKNTQSRQAVLQIWDPQVDMPHVDGSPRSGDVPCNVCSMLKIRDGRLFWTQVMRSNDLFRGTPYNFIQFTTLQEVLAGWLGIGLGRYTHLSDSLHIYERDAAHLESLSALEIPGSQDDLRLPVQASQTAWKTLNDAVDQLIIPGLTERGVEEVAMFPITMPMRNLLLIICADSARRRGFGDLAAQLSTQCTNPVLSLGWRRWADRKSRRATVSN
jgi:thymidylate synthase